MDLKELCTEIDELLSMLNTASKEEKTLWVLLEKQNEDEILEADRTEWKDARGHLTSIKNELDLKLLELHRMCKSKKKKQIKVITDDVC